MVLSFGSVCVVLAHVEDCAFNCNERRLVWVRAWGGFEVSLRPWYSFVNLEADVARTITLCQLFIGYGVIPRRVQVDLVLGRE